MLKSVVAQVAAHLTRQRLAALFVYATAAVVGSYAAEGAMTALQWTAGAVAVGGALLVAVLVGETPRDPAPTR